MKKLITTIIILLCFGIIFRLSRSNLEREVPQDGQTPEIAVDIPQNEPQSEYGLEDLLDAIEHVESYGDQEAIGDPIERPDLVGDYDKKSVAEYEGVHILGYQHRYFPDNENPIEYLVNDGKVYAKEYRAVGSFQIHKIYVDDVNRINTFGPKYTYGDRLDKNKSREMARTYLNWYIRFTHRIIRKEDWWNRRFEYMARIHNGGPNGWKKESTKQYWEKVKRELEGDRYELQAF